MNEHTINLLARIGVAIVGALILAGISRCTTETDMVKNADGTCDLSEPRKITFKTYRSCGEDCTRTIRHRYDISSHLDPNEQTVVTIHNQVIDPTSSFSAKRTGRVFNYMVNGPTLQAELQTQHNIAGYKTDPKVKSGDISVQGNRYIGGDAHANGYAQAMKLIKEVESRAKCVMPKPSQPGVAGYTFGDSKGPAW
jgi:hypothetical protein